MTLSKETGTGYSNVKDAFDVSDWKETKRPLKEKDIQGPSVKHARSKGWWARKFSAAPGNTSVPDYIFAKEGHVFFVEFKRPGGKPTELQQKEHARMRAVRLWVYVIDDVDKFKELLYAQENLT